MPNRSSKKRKQDEDRDDPNVRAFEVIRQATEPDEDDAASDDQPEDEKPREKNPAAVALGKLGGRKGGPARAKKLTPKERKEIARKAARARWDRKEKE